MAHACPICDQYCTCNGDWDDAEHNLPDDIMNCTCCDENDEFDDE